MPKNLSLKTKTFFLITTIVVVPFLALTLVLCNLAFMETKYQAFNLAEELTKTYKSEIRAELLEAQVNPETMTAVLNSLNARNIADRDMMKKFIKNASGIQNFDNIALIISISVITAILYFISVHITKPVLKLANIAKAIGEGNLDMEIPVNLDTHEIGVLSKAFKMMTEKLIAAKKNAESTSRAKGEFLSNMSHEMRTPLNAIIGMTAIGKSALGTEKKDYSFGKIEDASTHLLSVIDDVLDMAKIEANKMELSPVEFDFEKMVQRVVNVVNFRVNEKQQQLYVSIDRKIPCKLLGDDSRLSQVITNMLSNAVKFTPGGGFIRLDIRLIEEKDGVCTVQFTTADSGIGISPEQQSRLFTSFQQADSSTSRKFGGTGLGLVISKRIVEMMGGQIYVESELGKGASFIFTVKLTECEAGRRTVLSTEQVPCTGDGAPYKFTGCHILLAEDVEINREIVLSLLEPTELQIDSAETGAEALRLYCANPERYDMILMDLQMPEMDGLEATRKIRAFEIEQCSASPHKRNRVPIIAMTANVFRQDIDECLGAGMDDHVGKPLDMAVVLGKLRKYMPRRRNRSFEANTERACS